MSLELPEIREAPGAVTPYGGPSDNQPLYNKRRPKPQVPASTNEVMQLGLVPQPCSSARTEFALTKRKGRMQFRLTRIEENGQRHRFHLDKSELLAAVSAIHKCRSIMGAGA